MQPLIGNGRAVALWRNQGDITALDAREGCDFLQRGDDLFVDLRHFSAHEIVGSMLDQLNEPQPVAQ